MLPIRVLLIDDNSKFLDAATYFLSTEPRLEVVGCAPSGNEGLQEAFRLQPDLVLLDVLLPDINGLEVAHRLKTQANGARVVMMSLSHTSEYSDIARVVGVEACICKSEFGTRLLPLICTLFDR
jgi:DNA-binding NarL/FixJ family response regulator